MAYNKIIEAVLEDCEIISRVVDFEETEDYDKFNVWMFYNKKKVNKVSMTYIAYRFEDTRYVSEVLYQSLDLIRLRFLEKKTTKIYIDTGQNTYFFDLDFLKTD